MAHRAAVKAVLYLYLRATDDVQFIVINHRAMVQGCIAHIWQSFPSLSFQVHNLINKLKCLNFDFLINICY